MRRTTLIRRRISGRWRVAATRNCASPEAQKLYIYIYIYKGIRWPPNIRVLFVYYVRVILGRAMWTNDDVSFAGINCAGPGRLIYLPLRVSVPPSPTCVNRSRRNLLSSHATRSCFICPAQIFCPTGISQVTPRHHPYVNAVKKKQHSPVMARKPSGTRLPVNIQVNIYI